MEPVKNCDSCDNVQYGWWPDVCIRCSDASYSGNPYPLWVPVNVNRAKPFDHLKPWFEDGPCISPGSQEDWGDVTIEAKDDVVNHPKHYTDHPSGVECIQITEHMNFCLGNAIKYIWRAGLKSDSPIEDLKKARWYVDRELQKLDKS